MNNNHPNFGLIRKDIFHSIEKTGDRTFITAELLSQNV